MKIPEEVPHLELKGELAVLVDQLSCTNRTRSPTRPLCLQLYISKLIGGGMALLNLDELEGAQKVVERSELEVRRTPCILVRGDQACNILPDMKHVKGWNRCLGLK